MNLRRTATVILISALAGATPTASLATVSLNPVPHPGHKVSVRAIDDKLLAKVNHDRKAHHLDAYTFSPKLWKIANAWAKHLAGTGALAHRSNLDALVHQRCSTHSKAGENVAYVSGGKAQAKALFHQYVSDKPHRANVLSDTFTHIGIASVKKTVGGQVQEWSVMDVATHC
jgi:uncharacterized protein YkwD